MKKKITFMLALAMLTMSACSAQGTAGTQTQEPVLSADPVQTEEASKPEQSTELQTIVVDHAFGTTEIPAEPERIVSVYLEDMLLALEVPLKLAVTIGEDNYLSETMSQRGIATAAAGENVNFELIAEQDPDLIITMDVITPEVYESLSKIAPTIAFSRRAWHESIISLGEALGRKDQAMKVISDYDAHVAEAKTKLADVLAEEPTAAAIRFTAKTMRLYFPNVKAAETRQGYVTSLYEDLGFGLEDYINELWSEADPARENTQISMEILPELQSDYIFMIVGSAGNLTDAQKQDLADFDEMQNSDVWKGLQAVQSGRVYNLESRFWISDGPLADTMKIDQVVELLLNE
ncbi:MAG: ABC transporter substrate-binding protein [Solobacterium sp.]|nr:ABC transporter substrate-binding protein [Solobacterium sp.]